MPRKPPICPTCGTPLSCHSCRSSRAGAVGGRVRTPAKARALKAAQRAPRPGRRVYFYRWDRRHPDLPERGSLAAAGRAAGAHSAAAKVLDQDGKVVGWVDRYGAYGLD